MQTLDTFLKRYGIRSISERAERNPSPDIDLPNASHWNVTLTRSFPSNEDRHPMIVSYSMGSAHTGSPATDDVLNSLALDAAGFENARDFADWAAEYGYDSDSRSAEKIYQLVVQQSADLRVFLGSDERYHELLFETEGL